MKQNISAAMLSALQQLNITVILHYKNVALQQCYTTNEVL